MLTLNKAIEILEQHQKGTDPLYLPDLPDAERLGIEALQRFIAWRKIDTYPGFNILPSETEDEPQPTREGGLGKGTSHTIDPATLNDLMAQARWSQAEVVAWIRSKVIYQGLNVGGKFQDIIDRMSEERAEFLLSEINSRIEMA